MDPPSYEEANQLPQVHNSPQPPAYSSSSPPTPPPTYGEAVESGQFPVLPVPSVQHNSGFYFHPPTQVESVPGQFPVLTVPTVQHNSGVYIHPTTQVGPVPVVVNHPNIPPQNSPAVIYQPQPVPVVVPSQLTDCPAQVMCPHCHQIGTTQVSTAPSGAAWCLCTLMVFAGLICGCCLIPLFSPSFQTAQHTCEHCKKVVHVYKR